MLLWQYTGLRENRIKLVGFLKNLVQNEIFITKYKVGEKAFTRKRVWTFTNTFLFISSFLNKRQQTEVDIFFEELFDTPYHKRIATSSSFTQSRSKISHHTFVDAGRQLTEYYYKNFCTKRYCGMRLVAVDGSVLTAQKTRSQRKNSETMFSVTGNG